MKPKTGPARCICGRKPSVNVTWKGGYVYCNGSMTTALSCWAGPERRTRHAAIRAWNRMMGGRWVMEAIRRRDLQDEARIAEQRLERAERAEVKRMEKEGLKP